MKKNIKGFTLIELLAVIVILAIIAVIATPIVINVINDSKKKAFENTAYGVIEAAKNKYVQNQLNNKVEDIVVDFSDQQNLEMSGVKPKGGQAISTSKGVSIAVYDGKYCAIKGINDNKVEIVNYDVATCKIKETATVTGKIKVNIMQNDIADKVATIQLKSDNKVIASATTDSEGNYTINNVPFGSYEINVSNGKDYYFTYSDYGYKVMQENNTMKDLEISYGDFNKDGAIGEIDNKMLHTCYTQSITSSNPECALYDLNKDFTINLTDYTMLMSAHRSNITLFSSNNKISLIVDVKYEGVALPELVFFSRGHSNNIEPIVLDNGDLLYENMPAGVYTLKITKKRHTSYYNDAIDFKEGKYALQINLYAGNIAGGDEITQDDLEFFDSNFAACENKLVSDSTTPVACKRFVDLNEDNVVNTADRDIIVKNMGKTTKYVVGFN